MKIEFLCIVKKKSLKSMINKHFIHRLPLVARTFYLGLDRFAGIIPGWKIPKFQSKMTAHQIGLKTDFFGDALLSLRKDNRFYHYAKSHTNFISKVSIRDENAILKSASGFLKILYPSLNLTTEEYLFNCLKPARELRQNIHGLLYNLDDEFKQYERDIIVDVM